MISLSKRACEELGKLLASRGADGNHGLRLAVRKGGCAGWQYEMKVGPPETGDIVVDDGGVRVIVVADSVHFLRDCTIDYSDELGDSGFKVNNPHASRSCGCGTSFEPDIGSVRSSEVDADGSSSSSVP